MEWEELVKGKAFIMDLGEDSTNARACCRYAAWIPENDGQRHRIVEVSNDLLPLKEKYNVSDEMILCLKQ
ncbi:MAG: hypothetical protein J6J86_09210 [Lachnospiraceae bacterium]|nr:hypothetical protein [Lachnospiraceae bacterium]